ncbi:MAG: AsmA family protein [Beijerinckiaceae bacterium]|nr:AsmA family protein [Beijerinckiaceae bacterium]
MSFLRETITILAILLVLALSAALAAPLFIDWSTHRGWVEERLSAALGGRVMVGGDIDLRLLPAPRMELESVSWRGAGEGAPHFEASRVQLEIAVAPLLQGVVRFVEARLDTPRFTASLSSEGAVGLPQPGTGGGVVAFERIEIRNGSVFLARAGAEPLVLAGLEVDADAASLQGPFRGSGAYQGLDGRGTFRFGAGVAEGDRLRVKFTLEPGGGAPQADLDGALIAEQSGAATRLRFEGSAALTGVAQAAGVDIPWRASGTLAADPAKARLEPMELRFGPQERQSTATGLAVFDAAAPALSVRLSAPQLDVDRLLDSKDAAGEAMARVRRVIAQALEHPPRPNAVAISFEASTPALIMGGDTITEASVSIERPRRGEDRLALAANLPGRSQVSIDGIVEGGAAARFAGKAQAGARDLPRLAEWIERADPDFAERLRGLPFRVLEASGQIEISRRAFAARGLEIRADRSTLTGSAAFTAPLAGEPARLFADFNSPALDLDGLPNLRGPARALQDADLNLSIDARAVRLAGVGGAIVDSGRIRGKLTRSAGRLDLERLSVENLGGATLTASGRLDADAAKLDARLEAQRLVELAALVRRVAPGPLADLLNERAVALSPARLDVTADAMMKDGALDLRNLRIDGSARGTRITGAVRPSGEDVEAEGELASNDTPMLLRQLGVEALPLSGAPRSRITLRAKGSAAKGYEAEGNGDIAGASLSFKGRVGDNAGRTSADGRVRIASKDATPLMQVLALAWPDAQISIPLDMAGDLSLSGDAMEVRALSGSLAGSRVSGDLRLAAGDSGARRALTGALSVDRMAFDAITTLALGPSPQPAPTAGRQGSAQTWSDRPFAPGLADPPPSRIDLRVAGMSLRGLEAREFHGQLVVGQGVVAVEDMSVRVGAAQIEGRMALRRDKGDASLAASLDVKTALDLRDQIAANVVARIEVAATGRSERALAGTLAGSGNARFTDIVIPRAAAEALDAVVALAEKDAVPPDERAIGAALQRALDRAPMRAARAAEFDLLAAGGVLRLQPVKMDALVADAVLGASFDLRTLSSEQVLDIISRHAPPNWTGASPRVRIVWSGPLDKASRAIDAASLVNGLSARAIVRESARIDAFEADIRERSMFNRRLRADEWRRQREVEIRAFLAEQEKLEKARLDAERRAQEQQRLLEEMARPAPPLQLPGAAPR